MRRKPIQTETKTHDAGQKTFRGATNKENVEQTAPFKSIQVSTLTPLKAKKTMPLPSDFMPEQLSESHLGLDLGLMNLQERFESMAAKDDIKVETKAEKQNGYKVTPITPFLDNAFTIKEEASARSDLLGPLPLTFQENVPTDEQVGLSIEIDKIINDTPITPEPPAQVAHDATSGRLSCSAEQLSTDNHTKFEFLDLPEISNSECMSDQLKPVSHASDVIDDFEDESSFAVSDASTVLVENGGNLEPKSGIFAHGSTRCETEGAVVQEPAILEFLPNEVREGGSQEPFFDEAKKVDFQEVLSTDPLPSINSSCCDAVQDEPLAQTIETQTAIKREMTFDDSLGSPLRVTKKLETVPLSSTKQSVLQIVNMLEMLNISTPKKEHVAKKSGGLLGRSLFQYPKPQERQPNHSVKKIGVVMENADDGATATVLTPVRANKQDQDGMPFLLR